MNTKKKFLSVITAFVLFLSAMSVTTALSQNEIVYGVFDGGVSFMAYEQFPAKTTYNIGEELDLSGLEMSIFYFPDGSGTGVNYKIAEGLDPLEYTDLFNVDTSAFDNTKCGEYEITITPTRKAIDSYSVFYDDERSITVYVVEAKDVTTTTAVTTTTTTTTTTSTLQNFVDVTSLSQTTTLSSDVIISTVISVIPLETTAVSNISGTYENLSYIQHEDHIEIVDCDETVTEVIIPDEINGLPVTIIGDSAFSKCSIEDIVIPENITYIGYNAFYSCYPLNSITFESRNCKIVTAYNNGWADTFVNSFYHSSSSCFTPDYTGTFYVYEDSTAHAYAESHYLNFSIIEESAVTTAITTTQTTTTTTTAVSLPQTSPTITSKITTSPCGNGDGIVTSAPPKATATTTTTSMTIVTSFLPVTMITSQTTVLSGYKIESVDLAITAKNTTVDKSDGVAYVLLTCPTNVSGKFNIYMPDGFTLVRATNGNDIEYEIDENNTFEANTSMVYLKFEFNKALSDGDYQIIAKFNATEFKNPNTYIKYNGVSYGTVTLQSNQVTTATSENNTTTTTTTVTTSEVTTVTPETKPALTGDADEDNELTVRDCAHIAIMIAEGKTDKLTKTADFNGDGIVNVRDAAAIARKLAEKL